MAVVSQKPQECQEDTSVAARLEAAKRKLHERYQFHENGELQPRIIENSCSASNFGWTSDLI